MLFAQGLCFGGQGGLGSLTRHAIYEVNRMPASPGLRARATRARGRGKAYFHTSD